MAEGKEVTVREPMALAMSIQHELERAKVWIQSGLMPAHVTSPASAVVVVQRGRELGLPPMEALSSLYVVRGKVTTDTKTMLALAWKSGVLETLEILESDATHCKVRLKRKGSVPQMFEFTMADANQLGVTKPTKRAPNKGLQYKTQPRVMLRWRVIAEGLRIIAPDALAGLYTHEEMGLPVKVQGEDIVLDGKALVQQEERETVKDEGKALADELGKKFDEPPPGHHEVGPLEPGVLPGEAERAADEANAGAQRRTQPQTGKAADRMMELDEAAMDAADQASAESEADAQAAGEEEMTQEQHIALINGIREFKVTDVNWNAMRESVGVKKGQHFTQDKATRIISWFEAMRNPPMCPNCGAQMKERVIETTQQKAAYEAKTRDKKAKPAFFCTNKVNGEWCNYAIWSRTGVEDEKK